MADPKKPNEQASNKPPGEKPVRARKKIRFFEAIRRVEIAMRDLSPEACMKLAEYATMHAREQEATAIAKTKEMSTA